MQMETLGERLRQAVRAAGGNQAVAEKSGVPLGTLGGYLSGGEQKLSNTVALAEACGVTVEWLATGRGPMRPGEAPPPPPPPAETAEPSVFNAYGTMDIDALAECAEAIFLQMGTMGITKPPLRRVIQAALLLYDELLTVRARQKAVNDETTR